MVAEPNRLDQAWQRIPSLADPGRVPERYTTARMERILAIAAAFASMVIGSQAVLAAAGGRGDTGAWHGVLVAAACVPLAAMLLLCVIGWGARAACAVFAFAYPAVLVLWMFAADGSHADPGAQPWIFYLVNVATTAAMIAFPMPLQLVWGAGVPALFAVARLVQVDFDPAYGPGLVYDVSFTVILSGVIITIGWMVRGIAASVDEAHAEAVESYTAAAAAEAAEGERVAVAALMHDSVLAALIAAERAQTPREHQLAVAMASEALTRLANAESSGHEGSDRSTSGEWIADELRSAAGEQGIRLEIPGPPANVVVPGRVARALALAATQAIVNAVEHAGSRGLAVSVAPWQDGLEIVVSDAGPGMDLASIPEDRLGIRGSIFARVEAVGGSAHIESDSTGTTVRLRWLPTADALRSATVGEGGGRE